MRQPQALTTAITDQAHTTSKGGNIYVMSSLESETTIVEKGTKK